MFFYKDGFGIKWPMNICTPLKQRNQTIPTFWYLSIFASHIISLSLSLPINQKIKGNPDSQHGLIIMMKMLLKKFDEDKPFRFSLPPAEGGESRLTEIKPKCTHVFKMQNRRRTKIRNKLLAQQLFRNPIPTTHILPKHSLPTSLMFSPNNSSHIET